MFFVHITLDINSKANKVLNLNFSYRKVFRVSHQSKKIPLCTAVGWRTAHSAKEVLQVNWGMGKGEGASQECRLRYQRSLLLVPKHLSALKS